MVWWRCLGLTIACNNTSDGDGIVRWRWQAVGDVDGSFSILMQLLSSAMRLCIRILHLRTDHGLSAVRHLLYLPPLAVFYVERVGNVCLVVQLFFDAAL